MYAIVAMGFNVVERTTRIFNFAYGDIIMWAPMGALIAKELWHWPSPLALLFGVFCAFGFSLLTELAVLRPFLGQPDSRGWLLSGLGASLILEQLAAGPFHSQQLPFSLALPSRIYRLGQVHFSLQSVLIIGSALACYLGLRGLYRWTRIGKMLIAAGEDSDGAQVCGISINRMSLTSVLLAGGLAAIVGLATAPILLVYPTLGFSLTFLGFVAVAMGGIGSIEGGLIGGLIIGIVGSLVAAYWSAIWTDTAIYSLLLVVYMVRPWGLFGQRPIRAV
jgi:branched-chain amino acid transport system permease protein